MNLLQNKQNLLRNTGSNLMQNLKKFSIGKLLLSFLFLLCLSNNVFAQVDITPSGYINSAGSVRGPVTFSLQAQPTGVEGKLYYDSTAHALEVYNGTSWGTLGGDLTAKYLIQTTDATLPNAQVMGSLGTGLVINTTTTGAQSIYGGTSCTNQFVSSLTASGGSSCASVNLGTMALAGTNQNSGAKANTKYMANGATAQELDIYGADGGSTSTSFLVAIVPSTGEDNTTVIKAIRGDSLGSNIPLGFASNGDGFIGFGNNTATVGGLSPTTTRIGSKGFAVRSDACYGFAASVSGPSIDTITSCLMYEASGRIKVTTTSAGSTYADIDPKQVYLGGVLSISGTAPTITSGFGTSPTLATGSITNAFKITAGTAPGTTGVIGLPTATTGWVCNLKDITTPADVTNQTATGTSSASFTTTIAWTANDVLLGTCVAF